MADEIQSSQSGVTVVTQTDDPVIQSSQSGVSVVTLWPKPDIQSSQSGVTVLTCPLPPAATGLSAIGYSDRVELAWTDNVTEVSDGYRIERSVNAGAWATLATVDPDEEDYTDNTAAPGSTYAYRVVTLNGLCETTSAEVEATFSSLNVYGVSYE